MSKGFYIEITNNLLDPKHIEHMKDAVWLFMWFLDKMTLIDHEKGIGKVLGGKPIVYEDVQKDLGISPRTYRRWIKILKVEKYIETVRTPSGLSITVNKAKKVFKRCATNGTSIVRSRHIGYDGYGTSNIRQYSKTNTETGELKKIDEILKSGKRPLTSKEVEKACQ
jgi:hypothetical protein